jgi:hypothetical protein
MRLNMVESNDAARPEYLGRYRPCDGVEVVQAEERDERVGALRPPTGTYGLAATNRFPVSRSSRSGSVARPLIGDRFGDHEFTQSAV